MSHILRSIRHVVWMTFNLLAVTLLLLTVLAVHIPPEKAQLLAMLGVAFEWLVYVNLFFALTWLFTSRKLWCLVSILALVLSLSGIRNTWPNPFRDEEKPVAEHQLKVLTYNTHLLQNSTPVDRNELLRYVKNSGADVVCMQEYAVYKDRHYPTFNAVKRFLADDYPYTYFDFSVHNRRLQYGLAVYSKYPLINKQSIRIETQGNGANRCDIVIPSRGHNDTVRLFNNHLQSNSLVPSDLDSLLHFHAYVPAKLPTAYAKRSAQARAVRAEIDRSPYPVIVCGDFNDVPVSYTYHTLSQGLNDAFLSSLHSQLSSLHSHLSSLNSHLSSLHCSLGHTYVRRHVGIRIDYILSSPALRATDFRIDELPFSDHYPVAATLCW